MYIRALFLSVFLLAFISARAQQFASVLKISTDEEVYWYRICNASLGMQDYVMTDCSNDDDVIQVQLLQTEMIEERSLWKLTTVGNDGKVVLTNRFTGFQLGGVSLNMGNHNATQLTDKGSQGFIITYLGEDAFSLQSVEDDGVERFLSLAKRDSPALNWPEQNQSTSIIGWKFIPVESTGIFDTIISPAINVVDKHIFVSGCKSWHLLSLSGKVIPSHIILKAGIYLVKTSDRVVKVIVP